MSSTMETASSGVAVEPVEIAEEAVAGGTACAYVALDVGDHVGHDLVAVGELVHALVLDGRVHQVDHVDAALDVECAPHQARQVAQYGLEEQQKGHPLIVADAILLALSFAERKLFLQRRIPATC